MGVVGGAGDGGGLDRGGGRYTLLVKPLMAVSSAFKSLLLRKRFNL